MDAFQQMLQQTEVRYRQRAAERDEFYRKVKAGRVLEADTPERVEKRLKRLQIDRPTAETLLESGSSLTALAAPSKPAAAELVTLERILGTNDLIGVNFLELGLLVARAVGRIHIRQASGQVIGYGTGFMVSPRLLLTNNHVLGSTQEASSSLVEFNYQVGLDGKPLPSVSFALRPDEFFLTDETLDYTLVAVQPRSADGHELQDFGWDRLIEEEGKVLKGEYVNIIQHPNGEPKQLALRENQLVDILENFLHYHTDTAPGSSGSPVFNDQWEMVALHHSGVPRRDAQGNILTRDGQRWHSLMGEHRIDWVANEGVRVSRIVRHIKQQGLPLAQQRLRADMFELQPPLRVSAQPAVAGPVERGTTLTIGPALPEGGVMTWTIPLQVTVHVGQPTPSGVQVISPAEESELRQALEELGTAATRPYYDEEADAQARKAYYARVKGAMKASTRFKRLSQLLQTTHAKQLKYRPGLHLYPWVDLHPDLKLRSIYSGKAFDPEELIREDFRLQQEVLIRVREMLAAESTLSPERLQEEIAALEAASPYNCEHAVPQSWFGAQEPMRGDLHHLFTCEWGCNSFRGNTAYFDFADFEEAIRNECGKRMPENRFEPGSGKGAVARATLYFLLRYPGQIQTGQQEFDRERLPILLDWHQRYPVDLYEKHRNAAIFEKQGNRNPLIDFPQWATRIDFTLGFAT